MVIESFLEKYEVPNDKKGMMRAIIDFYIKHIDHPKIFAKEARDYTVREHIDPIAARAALMIFAQIRDDIVDLLKRKADEN